MARKVFGAEPIVLSLPNMPSIQAADSMVTDRFTFVIAGKPGSKALESIRKGLQEHKFFWVSVRPKDNESINGYGPIFLGNPRPQTVDDPLGRGRIDYAGAASPHAGGPITPGAASRLRCQPDLDSRTFPALLSNAPRPFFRERDRRTSSGNNSESCRRRPHQGGRAIPYKDFLMRQ